MNKCQMVSNHRKFVIHCKYFRYLNQTKIAFAITDTVKWTKFHLPSAINTEICVSGHVVYSSAACTVHSAGKQN